MTNSMSSIPFLVGISRMLSDLLLPASSGFGHATAARAVDAS